MQKVGIIRCQQTEDICPGTTDLTIVQKGAFAFEEIGPSELIGFVSCGGCPGKRAVTRAKEMVKRGATVIVFSSCISKGIPISFPCPHFSAMKAAVAKAVGPDILILEYTH